MQYMTAQGTKRWYDVVNTLVDNYNNAYHSKIKAKTKGVFFSDGVGPCQIAKNIKADHKMVAVTVMRPMSLYQKTGRQVLKPTILTWQGTGTLHF